MKASSVTVIVKYIVFVDTYCTLHFPIKEHV